MNKLIELTKGFALILLWFGVFMITIAYWGMLD
jgi:hypothetical protein